MRVPWVHIVTLRSTLLHLQNDTAFVYLPERTLKITDADAIQCIGASLMGSVVPVAILRTELGVCDEQSILSVTIELGNMGGILQQLREFG